MRKEDEILYRLENYKKNIKNIKNDEGRRVLKQAILELSWVLGEENNHTFEIKEIDRYR